MEIAETGPRRDSDRGAPHPAAATEFLQKQQHWGEIWERGHLGELCPPSQTTIPGKGREGISAK
jgi:hypothetical protein